MDANPESTDRRLVCKGCLLAAASGLAPAAGVHAGLLDKLLGGSPGKAVAQHDAPAQLWKWSREAYNYILLGRNIQCTLCPNLCKMEPDSRSKCGVRVHKDGKLYSLVYGNPAAVHVDPVEKKPLFHFYPGSRTFSMGFAGCNFRCLNCQNWELSQRKPEELETASLFPDQAVSAASARKCPSISYTYNEPSVVYEYMLDTSKAARNAGLKNIWVTNGYMNPEPLSALCAHLDAANVDLKAFSDDVYRKLNGGTLDPVLATLKMLKEKNVWFEITALLVPTYSDDIEMITRMCRWIRRNLGPDYPLHFSRFHPDYKLQYLSPTPPSVLVQARDIARKEGLHYPYIGNYRLPDDSGTTTFCPKCGREVIRRIGYDIAQYSLVKGACGSCGTAIAGRWT